MSQEGQHDGGSELCDRVDNGRSVGEPKNLEHDSQHIYGGLISKEGSNECKTIEADPESLKNVLYRFTTPKLQTPFILPPNEESNFSKRPRWKGEGHKRKNYRRDESASHSRPSLKLDLYKTAIDPPSRPCT
eukprot:Blabericola_migrator_1__10990@NODE_636_length_7124_cov_153_319683_g467_i0_p9_GENE_NODE_636_length_7124_cov_153_319683_g467_i0NODE_636_length_7124_cov_153_319683_g467_i0_p9_ORF_typecomplete_len132_score9_43_NODE_636_length_7124_cov_153_319683_g467_i0518913